MPVPPLNVPALRAAVGDLAHPQLTGCQLRVSGAAGRWYGTAGVAERDTGREIHERDTFRIGSITKVFVATVVLQLAAEHRLPLETPVQRCLPGLLPAHFPPVTVFQLLQHTSGLPDEQAPPHDLSTPESIARHRYDRWTPHQLVALVSHGPMKFTPGTKQEYRGINYVLLALLIEELTGRLYGEVIARRILRPLGLRHTSVPGNDPRLHGPHVHGYMKMTDGSLLDITAFDQSPAWGEGEMISHTGDLDRFLTALFSGELLPPRQLERMFTLRPTRCACWTAAPRTTPPACRPSRSTASRCGARPVNGTAIAPPCSPPATNSGAWRSRSTRPVATPPRRRPPSTWPRP
ncbi:serine hydrolase domain-containing protein [Streptomyces sp. NPDC047049]|uniref:serine hydrolase domain-containing protein n=1 Tax=Streptomyces sp. NPDC047049 TaxID=3156688 RepID=UPI0033C1B051